MHTCIHSPPDGFNYLKKRTRFSKLSQQILIWSFFQCLLRELRVWNSLLWNARNIRQRKAALRSLWCDRYDCEMTIMETRLKCLGVVSMLPKGGKKVLAACQMQHKCKVQSEKIWTNHCCLFKFYRVRLVRINNIIHSTHIHSRLTQTFLLQLMKMLEGLNVTMNTTGICQWCWHLKLCNTERVQRRLVKETSFW